MRRFWAGLVLACALAACGQEYASTEPAATEEAAAPSRGYAGMDTEADMRAGEQQQARQAAPNAAPAPAPPVDALDGSGSRPGPSQPTGPAPVLYLAYSYAMGLEIPSQRLSGVMDAHIQACTAVGPRQCQLIGSNKSGDPESYMEGYVSIRGEPMWLRTFMGGIEAQVDQADGRIISQTTNTEDLTRAIVDTEARLRALTALRDRLQNLLRSRPGRLADLLEVERELARVQGEIDSIQSNLAVMRTRVSMSELNIQYRSAPRPVGSDTFRPLRNALANFLGIVVGGFAAIVTIIAGLIPIAVVVVPIVWLILGWRKRRGGRFFERKEEPPAAPSA